MAAVVDQVISPRVRVPRRAGHRRNLLYVAPGVAGRGDRDRPEQTDAVLVARLAAGDESALAAAYDLHSDMVFGLARRVTRDEQLAREVTQDVFAYLWELPERVDLTRGTLRAYLSVIAHRRAVDEVRRHARRDRAEGRLAGESPSLAEGHEPGVVEAEAERYRNNRLAAVLCRLPDDQRQALMLAYFGGRTYREVAAELGIPEGTAKSRLRLALARLRELLEREDMRAWA